MKQDIMFCNMCGKVFELGEGDEFMCPKCASTQSIETYRYDFDNGDHIIPEKVMVRLNKDMQIWFYENTSRMLRDGLTIEKEIKNKRLGVHYNINNIVYNTKYMLGIIGEWKTYILTENKNVYVYKGYPGCLVTEANWRMMSEQMMNVKNTAEHLLTTVEVCWNAGDCEEADMGSGPSWEQLEEDITVLLLSVLRLYRFFKNGVELPPRDL